MKHKISELIREIDKSTCTVRDFNTLFSVIDKTTRQEILKIIKDMRRVSTTLI